MAAKCNITLKILDKLKSTQYNIKYIEDLAIAENYVEYLKCPDIEFIVCNNSPCDSESNSVIHNCAFAIGRIKRVTENNDCVKLQYVQNGFTYYILTVNSPTEIEFTVNISEATCYTREEAESIMNTITIYDVTEVTDRLIFTIDDIYKIDGYQYKWTVDSSFFDIIGVDTESTLTIQLKIGVSLAVLTNIVLPISVHVTNLEGCETDKQCYFNSGTGMSCVPYTPCFNVDSLIITMKADICVYASDLTVIPND